MADSRPYYPSPYAHGMPQYSSSSSGGPTQQQQPQPGAVTSPGVVPSYFTSPAPRAQSNCSTGSARKRVRTGTANGNDYSGDERDSPAASSAKGRGDNMRVGLNVKTRIHRACNACRKQKVSSTQEGCEI